MKTLFKLIAATALSLVAFVGCQKEISSVTETTNTVHFKIHAGSPETRTGIEYDGIKSYTPYWNNGDELGVLFDIPSVSSTPKDLTNDAVFSNTKPEGTVAEFEGDAELADGEGITFYSYYPASAGKKVYSNGSLGLDVPSDQVPVYNETKGYTFDPKADLLIAKPAKCLVVDGVAANEESMYFARITSVFRIELNAASTTAISGEAVKSIKVDVSSGDIAGRIEVNPITGEVGKTNSLTGSKSLTATYDVEDCPVLIGTASCNNVFLSVAPVTIPEGASLTFTIKTVNSSTGAEAHTLVKTISNLPKAIVFESSKPTVIKLSLSDDNIENNTIEYTLVKDVADLTVGSEVIIAAADFDYALGGQTSNNRTAVQQEKSNDGQKIVGPGETVQLLTIEAGNVDNTFSFSTGDGYLYAASSGSNYLRTEDTKTNNSSWSISINSETGVASIVAQGEFTRNTLQYNSGSTIFACYASASQKGVAIYKRSTPDTRKEVTLSFNESEFNLSVGTEEFTSFVGQTVNSTPSGVSGIVYTLTGDAIGTIVESTGVVTLNGSEGTATVTASFAGNESYKPATSVSYTITVDDPTTVDYVTLDWTYPTEGAATSSGISSRPGVSASGLGTDYGDNHSPYCIKFDTTDDYIQVKTNVAIGEVSVSYKMIGGGNTSTLNILESSDGETFTTVENLTISGSQNDVGVVTTTNTFNSASRFVKIHFTKGSNIGIGGISIKKVDTTPRFTVESPLDATISGGTYTVNVNRKYFDGAITVNVPSGCDWITATNIAANANSFNVTVSNNTGAARSATLTLSGSGVTSQELVVNQVGNQPGTEANPYSVAQALECIAGLDGSTSSTVWVTGTVSKVETYYNNYHSITYFISDDGSNTDALEVYSGKGLNNANFNDITDLAVGDKVVVKGTLKEYNGIPEFNQSSIITSIISRATRYTVTLGSVTPANSGSIAASSTSVGAQGVVTLTATPATGYELDKWTVTDANDESVEVSDNKFIMPASNVTVAASFKVKTTTDGVVEFTADGLSGSSTKISGTIDPIALEISTGTISSGQIRIFKNQTITLSSTSKTITKIEFTCTAAGTDQYGPGCFGSLDGYSYSGTLGTWIGSSQSVTLTASSNQVRATSIKVYYQ